MLLLRHALGRVLRRARLDRGLSLRQLAELARVSVPYLSEIERGRKEASSEILAALAPVLDLTLSELLNGASRELESVTILGSIRMPDSVTTPESVASLRPQRSDGPVLLAA